MNPLRSVPQAKINFLFFQDIITSVMGILILVTLMLSLSLNSGEATTPEELKLDRQLQDLREAINKVQAENAAAQQQSLKLAALPDRATLEAQVATLRQQATLASQKKRASENALAAAIQSNEQRAADDRQQASQLSNAINALDKQIASLRDQIDEVRTHTNAVFIIPTAEIRQSARQPVAFVVSKDNVEVHHLDGNHSESRSITNGVADLRPLLGALDSTREYVVFYFRPSGAAWFVPFRAAARTAGFQVGYDALDEEQEIIFSSQ